MTKIKKVVAMALAFLMIFSSASVLANAWTVTVDDGFDLSIGTKFFTNNGTDWVETEKVAPGDTVKARVYIGTDYYSNSSTLLFFYDKDFFTHGYNGISDLSVNSEQGAFTGKLNPAPVLNSQVSAGYIDSAFLDEYAAISVNLFMPSGSTNAMYDDSTWIFEFDLTVAEAATGEGDLFVKDTTVQNSTSQNKALVNVPKGPEGGTNADVWPMWRWNANVTLSSQPVSVEGTVTFNANNGKFADGENEVVVDGIISKAYEVPANPTRDGYTFIGWIDATDTTPTYEEAQATVPVATIPYEPVTYNAFWIKNVNITFDTDGGSEIPAHENVTPYTEFAAVAAPTKDGYTFVGWDVRGNMTLPETYPDVNTTYTAIWAKDVIVSFDTNGADPIEAIPGVAGEDFDYEIAKPSKEGHWFVKWSPALPTVFPEQDTTYKAIFETNVYSVYYYVEGKNVSNVQVEYGTEIPTTLGTVIAPEGMKLSGWYTDAAMTNEFVEGTVMGTGNVSLYAKYEYETYNAIFDANGGKFADGNSTVVTPTVYLDDIVVPADPSKVGYEFAGWTPYAKDAIFDEPNDMYFYATWNEVKSNVKYYSDGSPYEVYDLSSGEMFEIPADPYKEGYTFKGWAETEGGAVIPYEDMPATMPELEEGSTIEYYAVFEINEYTITWDVDGEITEKTYEYDAIIEALADPTKTGYTFAGWANEVDEIVTVPEKMPANDVTLKATWTIETYTLKFNTDGGNEIGDITVEYNENIIDRIPANPTKEGHTFTGWNEEIPTIIPDLGDNGAEKTFTATWSTNNYTVTWVVPGQEDQVDTVAYGSAITAPVPTKTGYVFAGWDAEIPATMPAEDLTFTGAWNPATDTKYTVNIHTMGLDGQYETATEVLEGTTEETVKAVYTVEEGFVFNAEKSTESGTVAADGSLVLDVYIDRKTVTITFADTGDSNTAAITGLYGTAVTAPADPVKEGYTFGGWNKPIPATIPAEDVTITATWTINSYTVTWVVDGETKDIVGYEFGAAVAEIAAPSKDGYIFAGWAWTNDNGETVAAPATMPAYNVTATATWANDTHTAYTVEIYTMKADGEYEATTSTKYGETGATVTAEYTVEEGFELGADSVTEGTIAADGSTVLKVYLNRKSYTLTVTVDDATTTSTVLYGAPVSVEAPSKEGYTFAGWSEEVPATMPAKDVTLVAQWTVQQFTVTFVVDGVEETKTLDYGAAIEVAKPVKEGYRFVAWADETGAFATVPATMPAKDLEFTAVFEKVTNVVNYYVDGKLVETLSGEFGSTIATTITSYTVPVGYELSVWYTDAACENELAEGATINAAKTNLYAKTTAKTYDAIFMVDGEVYETVPTAFDAEIIAPEAPTKDGYVFAGWSPAVETMDSEGKTFTATWKEGDYTVTYKVEGEADQVFGLMFGEEFEIAADPYKEGYTFLGWSETENGTVIPYEEMPETMPAENLVYYAVFEEVQVERPKIKLVPIEGSTGVVERNGVIESYNDGHTVTDAEYETPANYDTYYVYGLPNRRGVFQASGIDTTFTVNDTENGYFVLENSELSGAFGTGAKIKVYDKNGTEDTADDILVEEFWVIIFGDINGDGRINVADSTELVIELKAQTWSNRRNPVPYRVKSADLDLNSRINTNDSASLETALKVGVTSIDQTTGLAS